MANITAFPNLPNPPENEEEFKEWAKQVTLAIQELHRGISMRTEEMIMSGTAAEKPSADGRNKFYFETDTDKLYYDDGAWVEINPDVHTHTTGYPQIGQEVVLTYDT